MKWDSINHIEYYKKFSVQLPKSYLWAPDITVWNSAGENPVIKLKNDSILRVSSVGEVSAEISILLDTECELRLLRLIHFTFLHKLELTINFNSNFWREQALSGLMIEFHQSMRKFSTLGLGSKTFLLSIHIMKI